MNDDQKYLKGEKALGDGLNVAFHLAPVFALAAAALYGIEEVIQPRFGIKNTELLVLGSIVPGAIVGTYLWSLVEDVPERVARRTAKRICTLVAR